MSSISRTISEGLYKNKVFLIFVIFLVALEVTPLFHITKIILPSWLFFILFYVNNEKRTDFRLKSICTMCVAYIVICIFYKVVGISSASFAYCIKYSQFFLTPFALLYIDKRYTYQNIKLLFHSISLITVINIADGIRLFVKYPMQVAFQSMAEELQSEGITGLNLGGSMFVNMTAFFAVVMQFAFLKSENKIEKYLFGFYLFITLWFLIMCSSKASSIIIALLGVGLLYVVHRGGSNIKRLSFLFIITAIVMYAFIDQIVYFFIDLTGSQRLADRLLVFTSDYSGGSGEATLDARSHLWMVSIQSWLRNPFTFFFGIGDHSHLDYLNTTSSGIGNHSDFTDVLGRYGIFGALLFYGMIIRLYQYMKNNFTKYKNEIIVFFVVLGFMGFTKRFTDGEPAVMIFLLFPIALMYFTKSRYSVIQIKS